MLITSHGLKVVQGLTGDPARLAQALKKASGEISQWETVSTEAQADAATRDMPVTTFSPYADSLSALDSFVEYGDAVEAQFRQANAIETTMNFFLGIALSLSGVPGAQVSDLGDGRLSVLHGFAFHRARRLPVTAVRTHHACAQ
jgi:hypothetical protein